MDVRKIALIVTLAIPCLFNLDPAGAQVQHDLCLSNTTASLTAVVPGRSIGSLRIGMSEADAAGILSGATQRVPGKSGWVEYFYGEPPLFSSARVLVDPSGHVAYAESLAVACQTSDGIRGMISTERQVRRVYGRPSVRPDLDLYTEDTYTEYWLYNDRGLLLRMMKGAVTNDVVWIGVFAPHEYCNLPYADCDQFTPAP